MSELSHYYFNQNVRGRKAQPKVYTKYCENCGYKWQAKSPNARCPECGYHPGKARR